MIEGARDMWFEDEERRRLPLWASVAVIGGLSVLLWLAIYGLAFAQAGAGGPIPNVVGSQYLATPNNVADKQLVPLRVDPDGTLYVNATVGAGGTVTANQGTPAAVGSAWPVTLAIGGALNAVGNPVFVSPGTGATWAATQSGTWTVQPGNTANTTPWLTTPVAGTTGGATPYFLQPTASDNHATIKNGAGTAYGVMATNNSVTTNYLRLYNLGSGFNGCNSATGLLTQVAILPSGGVTVAFPVGMAFGTGLSICVTSGYATTDTTNATASAMSVTVFYN